MSSPDSANAYIFGLFYTVRGLTRRTGDVGLRLGDVSIVDQTTTDYIPALNARVLIQTLLEKILKCIEI